MPLLELRGVVSLSVDDGEWVAIEGPGADVLLGAVTGLLRANVEVWLEGERLYRPTPERVARRGVAAIPADRGTFGALSVLDNLRVGAWIRRGSPQRDLVRVFELFPVLYERRGERAARLSRDQQELLALGRAVMARARLLLVEQPRALDALRRLNDAGTAIVLATA